MGEAMSSGEIAAGSFVAPIALVPAKAKGAPVDFEMPPPGAWGARYYGMVLKTGPHPNAAQLFANYMVTAKGQELITPSAGSVLPDVPGTLITNDKVRVQDLGEAHAGGRHGVPEEVEVAVPVGPHVRAGAARRRSPTRVFEAKDCPCRTCGSRV